VHPNVGKVVAERAAHRCRGVWIEALAATACRLDLPFDLGLDRAATGLGALHRAAEHALSGRVTHGRGPAKTAARPLWPFGAWLVGLGRRILGAHAVVAVCVF
jgi:hypothetical protein